MSNLEKQSITKVTKFKLHKFLFLLLFFLGSCNDSIQHEKANNFKIIKAAHYFSDVWPKTFWQEFEEHKVEGDLEEIKNDGFNTIVLVVPWRGFEIGFENNNTESQSKLYQRLDFLLNKITSKKLDFILRIGFPHNFDPNIKVSIPQTCQNIYTKEKSQKQWSQFLTKINHHIENYKPYLSGVLISWEDFWCPHFIFPNLDKEYRLELAKTTGYADWLLKKNESTVKVILGKNELKKDEISLPSKKDGDYFFYLEFIDERFNQLLLNPAKDIFPQAAMEIRIDKDPARGMNDESIWISHDLHLDEKNHRGTYWAPFWGAENKGETLTLEQGIFNFEYFLNYVTNQGQSTHHVIEQFNFTDNTPYFPNNAQLAEDDVDDFLLASVPLLKKYSEGYGVWAYKDYADNGLYNSSFEMGLSGWSFTDKAEVIKSNQDSQLKLPKGSSISQTYHPAVRFMLARSYQTLNLCLQSNQEGTMDVLVNQTLQKTIEIKKGHQCFVIEAKLFVDEVQEQIQFTAKSDLIIDEIKLYGFVQKLGVYDEFGKEGPYLQAIRTINQQLDE